MNYKMDIEIDTKNSLYPNHMLHADLSPSSEVGNGCICVNSRSVFAYNFLQEYIAPDLGAGKYHPARK